MLNKKIYQTFYALLSKDITIYNKRWINRSIDALVWAGSSLLIAHRIMPLFGITDPAYGTFNLIGNLAIWGLFEMLTSIGMFLGDLQGEKTIGYYVSLPLPSSMLFIEQAFASAYRSIASSILILPLGKLILGNNLILSNINWPCFIFALLMINIFYGFFTLLIASYIPDLSALTMVRSRIMFPLWFLGGFQFPWKMLYGVAPKLAYVSLCNPIIYIMDGIRSTVLPTEQYLPFWNCMGMLILFSILFGYFGIQKLKQRLDCI
ncbi:MAG: ABC transporter permease [Candidatus Dependentiae bacterium]|nr:ABC transporter permease [Candidatus Dependentiae bacterium]